MNRLKELLKKQEEGTISEDEKTELAELEKKFEVKEVEVSDEIVKALGDTVKEMVEKSVSDAVSKALEANEKIVTKKVVGNGDDKGGEGELGKEMKMLYFLKALSGDAEAQTKIKDITDYQGTERADADGGYLVPPEEFIAEVRRLEEQYGVAVANANVRRTNRVTVSSRKKTAGVTVTKQSELGKGTPSKLTLDEVSIDLDKYIGIAIVTEELEEDSAVDIYNELVKDFARAYAKAQDEIVFTDATTGITKIASTNVVRCDGGMSTVTFDELSEAMDGVPTPSAQNGKFYFHRTMLGVLRRIKDTNTGLYIWNPGVNGSVGATIWGAPYVLTEVLPALSASTLDLGFMVFGDLSNYDLIIRNQMTMTLLTEGTVTVNSSSINLGEQGAKALRTKQRMNGEAVFPDAFSVITTSASVS